MTAHIKLLYAATRIRQALVDIWLNYLIAFARNGEDLQ